jgi:hypothetical protein
MKLKIKMGIDLLMTALLLLLMCDKEVIEV